MLMLKNACVDVSLFNSLSSPDPVAWDCLLGCNHSLDICAPDGLLLIEKITILCFNCLVQYKGTGKSACS
jgi:hypothetical protein